MTAPPRKREVTVSRRLFIGGTLVGGTAAMMAVGLSPIGQRFLAATSHEPMQERLKAEATANHRSVLRTVIEAIGVFFANVFVGSLFDRAGIDHGGHAADGEVYEEQLESAPVSVYVRDNVVIPIIEESVFRLFPSSFFKDRKLHWGTGLVSNAVFSVIHNVSKPEPDKVTVHFDSIPAEQFVLGCYCWFAQRKGGFLHAAGAHVLYNNLCEAYWYFYESKLEKNQPPTESENDTDR